MHARPGEQGVAPPLNALIASTGSIASVCCARAPGRGLTQPGRAHAPGKQGARHMPLAAVTASRVLRAPGRAPCQGTAFGQDRSSLATQVLAVPPAQRQRTPQLSQGAVYGQGSTSLMTPGCAPI